MILCLSLMLPISLLGGVMLEAQVGCSLLEFSLLGGRGLRLSPQHND